MPAVITTDPLLPGSSAGKESACNAEDPGSIPGSGRSPGEENSHPPISWPEEFHGLYCPWSRKEFHLSKSIQPSTHPFRERLACVQGVPREAEPPTVTTEMLLFGQLSSLPGRDSHLQVQCDSAIKSISDHRPKLILENMLLYLFIRERGNKALSALEMASSVVKCLSVW